MNYIMVDIEADGPVPGLYSMVSFGAVIVEPELTRTFRAELAPISNQWREDNLAVCGLTREQTLGFPPAAKAMRCFADWIETETKPGRRMISDNPTFDGGFINYYFERFLGPDSNPFGHNNARHLGCIWQGYRNDFFASYRHLGKTPHSHDPLDDALRNAEVVLAMKEMGVRIPIDKAK